MGGPALTVTLTLIFFKKVLGGPVEQWVGLLNSGWAWVRQAHNAVPAVHASILLMNTDWSGTDLRLITTREPS